MTKISDYVAPGVATGDDLNKIFDAAKKGQFALPAVNVVGTNSINAVMEAAKTVNSPVIIQFSNGGGAFYAGKGLSNENEKAAIAGTISGALHVNQMAEKYGIPVILHTDHAAKKLLPWIDGLLDAGEEFYKQHNKPLFSSHMLDPVGRTAGRELGNPPPNIWNGLNPDDPFQQGRSRRHGAQFEHELR